MQQFEPNRFERWLSMEIESKRDLILGREPKEYVGGILMPQILLQVMPARNERVLVTAHISVLPSERGILNGIGMRLWAALEKILQERGFVMQPWGELIAERKGFDDLEAPWVQLISHCVVEHPSRDAARELAKELSF